MSAHNLPDPAPAVGHSPTETAIPPKADRGGSERLWWNHRVDLWTIVAENGEIRVRMPQDAATAMFTSDGWYKTQHVTGEGGPGAMTDPEARARFENDYFGYSDDTAPENRPVYGYVTRHPDAGVTGPPVSHVSGYGSVVLRLKERVKERSTVTVGDSWNENGNRHPLEYKMEPSRATAPHPRSVPENIVRHWEVHEEWVDSVFRLNTMVEAHVHGGVVVDDVEAVLFKRSPPSERLKDALAAFGIGWHHTG